MTYTKDDLIKIIQDETNLGKMEILKIFGTPSSPKSLRDEFAMSFNFRLSDCYFDRNGTPSFAYVAKCAYKFADAMLIERERTQDE